VATFVFTRATQRLSIDELLVADIRALLVMSGNNVSANPDAEFLDDLVLDEYDGLGYARVQLTGLAKVLNLAQKRTELHADNPIFPLLAPASFPIKGILFYEHVGLDSANLPLTFVDKGGFTDGTNGTGQDFEFLLGAAGLLYVERTAA
jgi:hypothetical protein